MYSEEACPISGEYTGIIPDAVGLCAKLYSDCRNQQTMFYTVSNCENLTEVYEGPYIVISLKLIQKKTKNRQNDNDK